MKFLREQGRFVAVVFLREFICGVKKAGVETWRLWPNQRLYHSVPWMSCHDMPSLFSTFSWQELMYFYIWNFFLSLIHIVHFWFTGWILIQNLRYYYMYITLSYCKFCIFVHLVNSSFAIWKLHRIYLGSPQTFIPYLVDNKYISNLYDS